MVLPLTVLVDRPAQRGTRTFNSAVVPGARTIVYVQVISSPSTDRAHSYSKSSSSRSSANRPSRWRLIDTVFLSEVVAYRMTSQIARGTWWEQQTSKALP